MKTNAGDLMCNICKQMTSNITAPILGSLVWLGKRLDLSKYISNSFALVRVDGTPNVDDDSNGSYIGNQQEW